MAVQRSFASDPDRPFELWELGETRASDECLSRYADLASALHDRDVCTARVQDRHFEIRHLGVPLGDPHRAPIERRGTRPAFAAVSEVSSTNLRSSSSGGDSQGRG
ncbi:MAG: hypothetical protein KC731_38270 [Myxococcales bacterium]|nr:hypothetical protein [Myxococcales bacterium]